MVAKEVDSSLESDSRHHCRHTALKHNLARVDTFAAVTTMIYQVIQEYGQRSGGAPGLATSGFAIFVRANLV